MKSAIFPNDHAGLARAGQGSLGHSHATQQNSLLFPLIAALLRGPHFAETDFFRGGAAL